MLPARQTLARKILNWLDSKYWLGQEIDYLQPLSFVDALRLQVRDQSSADEHAVETVCSASPAQP
jgi:hypothetical protein